MSFVLMRWAMRLPVPIPHPAARVLMVLADYADDHGGSCYPSLDTISELAQMARSTTVRAIAVLRELDIVRIEEGGKRGRAKSTRYQINLRVGRPQPRANETPDLFPESVAQRYTNGEDRATKRTAPKCSAKRHFRAKSVALGAEKCSAALPDSTINQESNLKGSPLESPTGPKLRVVAGTAHAIPGTRLKPSGDDGFDAFYAAYPRHSGKEDALKEWRKLIKAGTDPAEIMAGLARFRHNPDPQFIMEPRKWLHGKRWQDEIPADFYTPPRRSQPTSAEDVYERALRAAGAMDERDHPSQPQIGGLLR